MKNLQTILRYALYVVLCAIVLGIFYPVVVGGALAVCLAMRPSFRPPPLHWLALAVPGGTYHALEIAKSRQHLNMVYVVPLLAIVAVVAVVAACLSGRSVVMPIGAVADTVLAVALWWKVRTFMPRMF